MEPERWPLKEDPLLQLGDGSAVVLPHQTLGKSKNLRCHLRTTLAVVNAETRRTHPLLHRATCSVARHRPQAGLLLKARCRCVGVLGPTVLVKDKSIAGPAHEPLHQLVATFEKLQATCGQQAQLVY